jgi:hypothetical protein
VWGGDGRSSGQAAKLSSVAARIRWCALTWRAGEETTLGGVADGCHIGEEVAPCSPLTGLFRAFPFAVGRCGFRIRILAHRGEGILDWGSPSTPWGRGNECGGDGWRVVCIVLSFGQYLHGHPFLLLQRATTYELDLSSPSTSPANSLVYMELLISLHGVTH